MNEPSEAEAATAALPAPAAPIVRHDGWTGEKIAIFCETLAETAFSSAPQDAQIPGQVGDDRLPQAGRKKTAADQPALTPAAEAESRNPRQDRARSGSRDE